MTSPAAFLYRYTPGSVGKVRIFWWRSIRNRLNLFYSMIKRPLVAQWLAVHCSHGTLSEMNTAAMFVRRSVPRPLTIGYLLMAAAFGVFVIVTSAQSSPASQSSPRPAESKPAPEKSPEAQPAAQSKAHHFDRVVIIVLENADYE